MHRKNEIAMTLITIRSMLHPDALMAMRDGQAASVR